MAKVQLHNYLESVQKGNREVITHILSPLDKNEALNQRKALQSYNTMTDMI